MQNINFAKATKAELEAAGYTVTVRKSQMKTRRTRKSLWGVRPSMNNNTNNSRSSLKNANLTSNNNGSLRG